MNENNTNFFTISQQFKDYQRFKEQAKQNLSNQNITNKFDGLKNMYQTSQTATDTQTKQKSDTIVRLWEVAMKGREYASRQWKDWSAANDERVINTLSDNLPNFKANLDNYMMDTGMDATGFAINMWWQTPEVEEDKPLEETFWQKLWDFGVWVIQSPWKFWYNIIWQWIDRAAKAVSDKLEWSALQKRVTQAAIDMFWEDEVNAYVEQRNREIENWTAFNGREQTDIRTPILWEERADSKATKAWEIVWDIASTIALTAPLAWATAPMYASATPLWAWILWGLEWTLWAATAKYWAEWEMASGKELALWAWLWAVGWLASRWLANLPKTKELKQEVAPYIEKSIKPTVKWKKTQGMYDNFIDDTIDSVETMIKNKNLIEYTDDAWNIVKWELPKTLRQTSEAIQSLKKAIFQNYDDIAKQAWDAGAKVNMNNVYSNLDDLLKDTAQNISNPNTKAIVEKYQQAILDNVDEAWNISVDTAQKLMQDFNAKLTAYFKNPNNLNDVSELSVIAKMNQWIKDAMNKSLDDAIWNAIKWWSSASADYNALKQMYAKLLTIEDEVSKRALVAGRQNSKWLADVLIGSSAWWDIAEALLTANPTPLAKWILKKLLWAAYKNMNSVDTNIQKVFSIIEKNMNWPSTLGKVGTAIKWWAKAVWQQVLKPNVITATEEAID